MTRMYLLEPAFLGHCQTLLPGLSQRSQTLNKILPSRDNAKPTYSQRQNKRIPITGCTKSSDKNEDDDIYFERLNIDLNSQQKKDSPKPSSYLTVEQATELQQHALSLNNDDIHKLADLCSRGFVEVLYECYPSDEYTSIFIVIGTGFNGVVGLHIALHLRRLGYEPFIYTSGKGNKYVSNISEFLQSQPENEIHKKIEMFDFIPSTFSFYFDVVVDSMLGVGFDGGDIHPHFWTVYEMLVSTDVPIMSVDIPSGWDLSIGPRHIDVTADTFIKPDVLVSLGAPKLGSKRFAGEFHFIAAVDELVPKDWLDERGIDIPRPTRVGDLPQDDNEVSKSENEIKKHSVLFKSNANAFGKNNGEMYGRPGQFDATLFTKNPKRKWVDIESEDGEDILWDELD